MDVGPKKTCVLRLYSAAEGAELVKMRYAIRSFDEQDYARVTSLNPLNKWFLETHYDHRRYSKACALASEISECPLLAADSTRRRHSFMKSLCWRFVVQRLSRSFVEAPRDRVELGLRIFGEVDPLGEILPQ